MNDIMEKQQILIEDIIYEVRGVQVMLNSEISITKCHYYLCDKIITYCDIGKPISMFNNFIIGGKIVWN